MAEKKENLFDDIDEPVQVKRIKDAGIYRNVKLTEIKLTEASTKEPSDADKAKGVQPKRISPYMTLQFTTQGEGDAKVHEEMVFCPPTDPNNLAYVADKYVNGQKAGKKTSEEQMKDDWQAFGMFLCQIATACSQKQFAIVKTNIGKHFTEMTEEGFLKLVKAFQAMLPADKVLPVDIKMVWNNSDKKKTSFLRLAKASASNWAIAPHKPDLKESTLQFSDYETKNQLKAKYTGFANPPKGSEEIIDGEENTGSGTASQEFDEGANVSPDDLF